MNVRRPQLVHWLVTLAAIGFSCFPATAQNAQWTTLTPLPDYYQEHTLIYANDFLYNIGGVSGANGPLDGTNVFYSQVYNNGTIGTWNHVTPLPVTIFDSASVAEGGFIYTLGGNGFSITNVEEGLGYEWTTNAVFYAQINTNGTLGAWQVTSPLPQALFWEGASVWNHTIYISGGANADGVPLESVYSAKIHADGSLSAWMSQISLPQAIFGHCQVANGYLYVLGGVVDNGNEASSTVYFSKINPDGTLVGWNETSALPQPLASFAAISENGLVLALDGLDNNGVSSSCYSVPVFGDEALGNWLTITSLPQPLYYHAAAVSSSYIFVSGGSSPEVSSKSVYSMPLPSPPATLTLTAQVTNQTLQLQLTSSTNTGFGILASPDLINWTNIGWSFTDTNGLLVFQDTNAASFPYRFYRAYWPLP